MKTLKILSLVLTLLILASCEGDRDSDLTTDEEAEFASTDDMSDISAVIIGGGQSNENNAGKVTAGEWNDLSNWDFWNNLLNHEEYSKMPDYWSFYTNNRISVKVQNNGSPITDAKVELLRNGSVIWASKTDNLGVAELWGASFQKDQSFNANGLTIRVNGNLINQSFSFFENGVNTINLPDASTSNDRVELSFIVDATGSMGDELEFLKDDLQDVIAKVKNENSQLKVYTSAVFYRDQGDEYVTRKSDFTQDLNSTIGFIGQQKADGGGDFPEAVHTALNEAINQLQWSTDAKTRIAFLLLDAPPHYENDVVVNLQKSVQTAAEKGIKIIPITASGIDKETEFLMRFMSILTNGTYVFITNHSGIGDEHLEASVGEYDVELLNDLLVRLIKKYSE